MGEIEEAIRRAQAEAARKRAASQHLRAVWAEQERVELVARVEALAPRVLEDLARAGWPDAKLVPVDGFGRRKRKREEVAGWAAGGFLYRHKGEMGSYLVPIHLLRDGRWCPGVEGPAMSFDALSQKHLGEVGRKGSTLLTELPHGVEEALEDLRKRACKEQEPTSP